MFTGIIEDLIRAGCSIGGGRHSPDDSLRFEETLSKLIHETSTVAIASQIKLDAQVKSFLGICKELLGDPLTSAPVRSRIHLALFNICLHNVPVRRYLAGAEVQMCAPVYECLQVSLREQLGPQNLIDTLRLLQVLTYERQCLAVGGWTSELINSFLLAEILRNDGAEWLPYCVAILSNLVCRSRTLCNKLKRSTSYKTLCSRLLQLLSHNSRTVVIGSLMLIGHLDDKTRDTVFGAQNIAQTVACIVNVMTGGDSVMTTHIAIDLLRKLVVNDSSEPPTLNAPASELPNCSFFVKSLQNIVKLTITLDSRMEECSKVHELLVAFCRVGGVLRSTLCSTILKMPVSERRLTTPCLAISRTASIPFDEVDPNLPLSALKLLTYLLSEAVDAGIGLNEVVPSDSLCRLVETCVKTAVETKSPLVRYQCMRITDGLRLAEVIANDEDMRTDLLEVVNAPLCAHISEAQLISNPIVNLMSKITSGSQPASHASLQQSIDEHALPDWSLYGVGIPLQLLKLLATLKDYSRSHKELYWRSLKDNRLVPFLAFAIAKGHGEMVNDALVLYNHCAQVQEFPTQMLSQFISTSACIPSTTSAGVSTHCTNGSRESSNNSFSPGSRNGGHTRPHQLTINASSSSICTAVKEPQRNGDAPDDVELDVLLDRMRLELCPTDIRFQYFASLLRRTLVSKSRNGGTAHFDAAPGRQNAKTGSLEVELAEALSRNKSLTAEGEVLARQNEALKCALREEKSRSCERCKLLLEEKSTLGEENDRERELHTVLRGKFDELAKKFDIVGKSVLEKQREIEVMTRRLAESEKASCELERALADAKLELQESKNTVYAQLKQSEELRREIGELKEEALKLADFKAKMAKMLSE